MLADTGNDPVFPPELPVLDFDPKEKNPNAMRQNAID